MLSEPLRFTTTGETRGLMVVDGPGGGTFTLISRVLRKHPVLSAGPDGQPRYLDAIVPSPATFKRMGQEILVRTAYPVVSGRRDTWNIWRLVRSRMSDRRVVLLWIDEAHDLFCADRNLILRGLRFLMQESEEFVPILSDIGKLEEILRSAPQLWRRFTPILLPRVNASAQREELAALVYQYCVTCRTEQVRSRAGARHRGDRTGSRQRASCGRP